MTLGNNIAKTRKQKGYSQQQIADKLGVSRQTISKWEIDETTPDIYQAKKLAQIFQISLDELIQYDHEIQEIENFIENDDKLQNKNIDWNKMWGKKYPILQKYKEEVNIAKYQLQLDKLLNNLQQEYKYDKLESFLVLKDILATLYK